MKKTVSAMIRFDEDIAERIMKYADRQGLKFTTAIRSLTKKALDEEKSSYERNTATGK